MLHLLCMDSLEIAIIDLYGPDGFPEMLSRLSICERMFHSLSQIFFLAIQSHLWLETIVPDVRKQKKKRNRARTNHHTWKNYDQILGKLFIKQNKQ